MLNRSPLFWPVVLIALLILSMPAFPQKWSSECEEQFRKSIKAECQVIRCKELDEGR